MNTPHTILQGGSYQARESSLPPTESMEKKSTMFLTDAEKEAGSHSDSIATVAHSTTYAEKREAYTSL
jgi:hypothetical protein